MFNAIMTWLTTNGPTVVSLFVTMISAGVDFIYDGAALTEAGELTLFGAAVGLSLYGIRFVRGIIPFTR